MKEGVIKYADKTDAAKGGGVEEMMTLDDEGGRGGWGNADVGLTKG